jgi:hypothetical protein
MIRKIPESGRGPDPRIIICEDANGYGSGIFDPDLGFLNLKLQLLAYRYVYGRFD